MDPMYEMMIGVYLSGCTVNCGVSIAGIIDAWSSSKGVRSSRNEQLRLQEKRGSFYFRALIRTLIWPYDWTKNTYCALKWCVKK